MYRKAIEILRSWKKSPVRKPLVIEGARQVGKTWLMKEFGRTDYKQMVYVNCDKNDTVRNIFSEDLTPDRLISRLEIFHGEKIEPDTTLIIFDEIQEIPRALSSLKYFAEEAPKYHIICAGSLLGIALHQGTSFPVGKVDILNLYPLTFTEFLFALGECGLAKELDNLEETAVFHEKYVNLLKQYYFTGGMPEVVRSFAKDGDYAEVRRLQTNILSAYEQDFSKHAPASLVPRIRQVWESVPAQFAKENKKFKYGIIKQGARAKDFESALLWLKDCGLIYQVYKISTPRFPLKAYQEMQNFKLFVHDTGLLCALAELSPELILEENALFTEFKGALCEQYVCSELIAEGFSPYYWTNDKATAEIDFLIACGSKIIPVEVKAGINLQAKSLKVYREKYSPEKSIRMSLAKYKDEGLVCNLPLYAAEKLTAAVTK
ncbi:MAG TPA: ATP-binding protein [Methanocorpusculum sp.]|nr:ATP-binding protein [Methanocorpusculum sp.]